MIARPERKRRPTHPGEALLDILNDRGITQSALAEDLGIPFQRVNQLINGRRAVTPDTALRLGRYFETGPELWMNLQVSVDLWDAKQDAALDAIVPASLKKGARAPARAVRAKAD